MDTDILVLLSVCLYIFIAIIITLVLAVKDVCGDDLFLALCTCTFWPIVLPLVLIRVKIKKFQSLCILDKEKLNQVSELSLIDVLAIEQENEKLLAQYHTNMVRISEIEFEQMKKLSQ